MGFSSLTYINWELKDCQTKKISVLKTNLSECQGQEAVYAAYVYFFLPKPTKKPVFH